MQMKLYKIIYKNKRLINIERKNMKISKVKFIFYFTKSKNRRVSVKNQRRNFK